MTMYFKKKNVLNIILILIGIDKVKSFTITKKITLGLKTNDSKDNAKNTLTESDDDYQIPENFFCTTEQLNQIYKTKENFSYFDLIFTQDILTELYQIEARAFQNFIDIEILDGWKDPKLLNAFIQNFNNYIQKITERDELIQCEILTNLLIIRSHKYSSLNSFSLKNLTVLLAIDENCCQKEIDTFSNRTKSIGYFEELSPIRLNQTKQEFKEILSCFLQTYKAISTYVVRYKNLYSIRDLEIKLVTLLVKTDIHLENKLTQLSNSVQDLIRKLN